MKSGDDCFLKNLDSVLKSRDITLLTKVCIVKAIYDLPRGHVLLWELDHKEGRMLRNLCFRTVVLEKTPESPLESKEIKPVNLQGDEPWIFTGRTNAKAEAPVFWSSDESRWLTTHWKSPWCWERLRAEGEEGVRGWDGWMESLINGHKFGQTSRDGEGQGSLACSSPWVRRVGHD